MHFLLVNLALFFIHDFFVSVSYIEYDNQRNAIEAHKKTFLNETWGLNFCLSNFDIELKNINFI